jgi:hypothetical protein
MQSMPVTDRRAILMGHRKAQLSELIQAYYLQRGWNRNGIPSLETLNSLGLWPFLSASAREVLTAAQDAMPVTDGEGLDAMAIRDCSSAS